MTAVGTDPGSDWGLTQIKGQHVMRSVGKTSDRSGGAGTRARTRDDAPIPAHSGGLRFEATLALPVIGVVASFDYFPDDGAFTSSVLARLSL